MKKNKNIKVLLVDDEVAFVNTLAQRLRMRKLLVDTVYDGEQALSYIKQIEPDVIVLDLKMPGLHGIEVLREIKKIKREIQVIILTGHGTDKDEEEAKKLGGFDFLRKPADIDLLLSKIKEAFSDKLARFMTAIAFAQEGELDEARKIIKKEQ
ncbi:MAG TPA: response regulator [Dissulfurispiraceae bacterium]|nr:response regulator [Dissulfurispiraceae bacterium]